MTKKKQAVNWEKLCRQLQEALAKEMKENEILSQKFDEAAILAVKKAAIVEYLEDKLSECMDMINGNEPV